MQMIDVLKRLADLDSANPRVEKTMTQEQSLATITNIEGSQVNECGPMGGMDHHTPATLNITADNGQELTGMLRDLMQLAGVKNEPAHQEIEIGTPHSADLDGGDDLQRALSVVDRLNGPTGDEEGDEEGKDEGLGGALVGGAIGAATGGPLGALTGAAAGDSLTDPDPEEKEGYDNEPKPEVEPHDFGDKQVTPKPQGLKQRLGDNPYKPVGESLDVIASQLLKAYEQFKNQQ